MAWRGSLVATGLIALSVVFQAAAPAAQAPAAEAPKPGSPADTAKPQAPADTRKPETPPEKPFAEVIKDARAFPGLFALYRTDEKVWLELSPAQFDRTYMLSVTCESGIGERGFYAAQMCGELPIRFHRQGKNVQVVAPNTRFQSAETNALHRSIDRSFSDSILGSTPIASQPHPERQSILIDLGAILLTDLPMQSYALEATFRIPYRFDAKNSYFGTIKSFERNVEIGTVTHYAAERPGLPPLAPGPGPAMPPPPRNLPDVRSMTFEFRYSLSEVPATPGFRPRAADDRVGHFFAALDDFTTDAGHTPTVRYITRWHIEKASPSAATSRPTKPIVFWMENTVPAKYRDAVRQGALLWNKAFERIGLQDVIVVNQQPDEADWDPADVRYNTIRWFAATDAGFAIGPSRWNPATGELYDADISFSDGILRAVRGDVPEILGPLTWDDPAPAAMARPAWMQRQGAMCTLMADMAPNAAFGLELLALRGLDPAGPEADAYVNQWLVWVAAHEVGHTLGLRHNFRASTIHDFASVHDKTMTSTEGLSGSVMDYIPVNLARPGQPQGQYHQTTLGPYDYWAIEYAYKPIAAGSADAERAELRAIASRVADPKLSYGTDEDAGFGSGWTWSSDPLATRGDLGSEPLEYFAHTVGLVGELWNKVESKLQTPGEGYQILRRSFLRGLRQAGASLLDSTRYIGGVYHYRDHVGDPGGRLPFVPVPAGKQRQALALVRDHLFAPEAFKMSPALLNKLTPERFPNFSDFSTFERRPDFPVHQEILSLQSAALGRLFHPTVMTRVLDNELRVASPADTLPLSTVFATVRDAIWAETSQASVSVNSFRRALQREHLRRLISLVVREAAAPEDARSLARHNLTLLRARLAAAAAKAASVETRAHLAESMARIDEALSAQIQRSAF
jgi:hypothetical protein